MGPQFPVKVTALGRPDHSTQVPKKHLAFTVDPQVWEPLSFLTQKTRAVPFHRGQTSQTAGITMNHNVKGQLCALYALSVSKSLHP